MGKLIIKAGPNSHDAEILLDGKQVRCYLADISLRPHEPTKAVLGAYVDNLEVETKDYTFLCKSITGDHSWFWCGVIIPLVFALLVTSL